jgi:hypothetical protein
METSTERRWRLFLTLEMVLITVVAVDGRWLSPEADRLDWMINAFTIWSIVSLPIFLCTVGRGFVASYADAAWPNCPEEKALWRELRSRSALDDAEFYVRFYQHSGIPKEVITGFRQILRDIYFDGVDQLVPSDDLRYIDVDLGFGEPIYRLERTFRITIAPSEWGKLDYSFDGMIRLVHRRAKGNPAWADDAIG